MTQRFDYTNYDDGTESIYDREKDEYYFDCEFCKLDEVLNELDEKYVDEHCLNETLRLEVQRLETENEQLKQTMQSERRELISKNNEYRNKVYDLEKENEKLKQAYTQLKHRHSLLHDVCIDAECDRDSYRKDILSLEKENERLKKEVEGLKVDLKVAIGALIEWHKDL